MKARGQVLLPHLLLGGRCLSLLGISLGQTAKESPFWRGPEFLSFTQTGILGLLWWSPLFKGISWQDAWPDAFIRTGSSAGIHGPPPPCCAKGAEQLHSTEPLCPGSSTFTYHEPRRSWPHALSHSQRKLDFLGLFPALYWHMLLHEHKHVSEHKFANIWSLDK